MTVIAETPRLLIRTWTPEDVGSLCDLSRKEGLSEFSSHGYANFSEERAREWILKEVRRFAELRVAKFAVISKELKLPIGISGIFPMPPPNNSEIELNYRYPREHRGQGFATEAAQAIIHYGFKTLNLPQINAVVELQNHASQAVLARLGMKRIGEITYKGVQAGHWVLLFHAS